MKVAEFFMLCVLASCSMCFSQTPGQSFSGEAVANVDLPERVVAPDDQITIWADFQNTHRDGVPVYVVNKTAAPIRLENQDGDIYLKLETRDSKGGWTRAQTHKFSWCGNSYGTGSLQPGMHFRLMGYQPITGRRAELRFTTYSNLALSSNVGQGLINDQDIEASKVDGMSLRNVPRVFCDAFDSKQPRDEMTPAYLAGCLGLLRVYGDVPALRHQAHQKFEEWSKMPSPSDEVRKAVAVFQEILDAEWSAETSSVRLLRYCINQLQHPDKKAVEVSHELLWRTIGDLARSRFAAGNREGAAALSKDWKAATTLALDFVKQKQKEGSVGVIGILSSRLLVDSFISTEQLEEILKSELHHLVGIAASALTRRGHTEKLAQVAMTLSNEAQMHVFVALATGGVDTRDVFHGAVWEGVREPRPDSIEERFWQHVVATQPLKASSELDFLAHERFGPNIYSRVVQHGVREFWQGEIRRSKATMTDFEMEVSPSFMLRQSISYLAHSRIPEDAPLFKELLAYRGYEVQKGERSQGKSRKSVSFTTHCYIVRMAALDALNRLGVAPPNDVVVVRDVTDPNHVIELTNGQRR